MTTGIIITCPDYTHPFQLETNASDTVLGAVMTQNTENNHVIAFARRSLKGSEKKFSNSEKECLAIQ